MQVWYLRAGDDGSSRFESGELQFVAVEDVSPGGTFGVAGLGAREAGIVRFEPGFSCDFHNSPEATWMLFMQGQMEIEVSDGVTRTFGPGDAIEFHDASGQGHRSRVIGDAAVVAATAGFG